jgi:ferrochelatase
LSKKGVLLVNLGSPDSPTKKDVRKYLDEFLMDERVIDIPYLSRLFLVKGIILNTRPKKSAAAYQKVWWPEGSPLIVLSKRLKDKVTPKTEIPIALAMRYGNPSIKIGMQELVNKGVTDVLVLPLYPQFAMATTETILVKVEEVQKKYFPNLNITDFPAFYNKKEYIKVLGDSLNNNLNGFDYDHLVFSYHGVPERHIKKSDITKSHCKIDGECCKNNSEAHKFCYRHQCYETTKLVAEYLHLDENKYTTTFQSRLGKDPWIQPYTDETIEKLAQNGIKKLAIITPAFVSDCLETIEEIGMEAKESFLEHGGEAFHRIDCLNDNDDWATVIANWVNNWKTT